MRGTFVCALVLIAALATACDPGIEITVTNHSAVVVCVNGSRADLDCSNGFRLGVGKSEQFTQICSSNRANTQVLTSSGREFYRRTATCGEWHHSGAWITIDERNGTLIVTDSLGNTRATPSATP